MPPSARPRGSRPLAHVAAALALAALAFAAFSPALAGGWLNWDDPVNFVDNPRYRGLSPEHLRWMFTTLHLGPYQPLAWVTLGADHALWGLEPRGYHLTSLLLHAANAALAYALMLAVARRAGAGGTRVELVAAAAGAALFALHPLRAESVCWITERRDVLSGLFFLPCVLAYLSAHDHVGARRSRRLALAVVLFALSLLSKAAAMTLPVVLLALDAWPLRRIGPWRRGDERAGAVLLEKLPFLALALGAAALALAGQSEASATTSLARHGAAARAVHAAWTPSFYLGKTLLPVGLTPLVQMPLELDPLAPRLLAGAATSVALTAALAWRARRAPAARSALVAWVAFVVLLAPVSGLVHVGAILAADRYTYLPALALSALVTAGLARPRAGNPAGPAALVLVVASTLGALSWRQAHVWTGSVALWTRAVDVDDGSYVAHFQLAEALEDAGRDDEALEHYERALELAPSHAETRYNLGGLHLRRGELERAVEAFVELLARVPDHREGTYNLALALWRLDRPAQALPVARRAVALAPANPDAHYVLGLVLQALERPEAAREAWRAALRLDPGYAAARAALEGSR